MVSLLRRDLRQRDEYTDGLFAQTQPLKCDQLMRVVDTINARWSGVRCVQPCADSAGLGNASELMSQGYTARINPLWTVKRFK